MEKYLEEKLKSYAEEIEKSTRIDKEIYEKYSIKRGLRNKNGTGVLVGVTKVGDVYGYEIEDGEKIPAKGELYYRGYPLTSLVSDIEDTNRLGFEEIIYLLLFDKLPTRTGLSNFKKILIEKRKLPPYFIEDAIMKVPGEDIMNKMMRAMLALYTYDKKSDVTDAINVLDQSLSLISKMPLLAIYSYQVKIHYFDKKSLIIHNPVPEKSIAENILAMLRADQKYSEEEATILDR